MSEFLVRWSFLLKPVYLRIHGRYGGYLKVVVVVGMGVSQGGLLVDVPPQRQQQASIKQGTITGAGR